VADRQRYHLITWLIADTPTCASVAWARNRRHLMCRIICRTPPDRTGELELFLRFTGPMANTLSTQATASEVPWR